MSIDNTDVESKYNNLVNSLYQYLNESVKDFASLKPEILNILQTHRPIRVVDYQFGISKSLKGKSQLIVYELNQRSMVREYFKYGNSGWYCCECNRTETSSQTDEKIIGDLLIKHGIVFVKIEHDCKPRQFSFVQQIQKLYKEKKINDAISLQKSVLGSEDSSAPLIQNVVGKRGKTSRSSKDEKTKQLIDEITLKYAQLTDNASQENEIVDDQFDDENFQKFSPEESFTKIIENLEEYTNEEAIAVLSNKSRHLRLLKKNRPVRMRNYHYGLMFNLREGRRLIIFEWKDRERVRVYSNRSYDNGLWDCLECYCLCRQKGTATTHLPLLNGIVYVPYNHECPPRDYKLVMIYQKFLEEGDVVKARAMAKAISFAYGQNLSNINVLNDISSTIPGDENAMERRKENHIVESNSKTLTKPKRKMISNDENLNEKPPVHKKSKLNKSALDNTVMDKVDSSSHQLNVVNEEEQEIPTTSIFAFEKPSDTKLEEICTKLNIEFRNKAIKIWENITFNQIDTLLEPTNIETYHFQTENFYEILSKLFTGKSKQQEQIKSTIIDAMREKIVSSGEISTKKFNKLYLNTVTDEHFAFIAKFLSCRILILDGEKGIRKYGKWKRPESKRLTLVLAFYDGIYSIVISFQYF
uniref:Uncharacterized protein n=1 Tax=Panagrolaimus davidi TaxID=227884 RepID=A0A914QA95_9BILA